MRRRDFLQTTMAGLSGGMVMSLRGGAEEPAPGASRLSGFIVSDAHFGWVNDQQPEPELQRTMVRRILDRFPDLDLFVDTGDAHHGNLRGEAGDAARTNWMDVIANECGPIPFYFVAGNHDIIGTADGDAEWRCERLGSMSCRPYYSFDLKGVHFVALPEMLRAIYVTEESLEWLQLDLEINRDRTTIIFSHNNIAGTTSPYDEGYRGLVNSDAITGLLKRYPNVLAWMHGHNHNFEVVESENTLFVSNGRIGGFDPSRKRPEGSHGLGGIYFEVTAEGVLVRSYSAEKQRFLDEEGLDFTAGRLATPTTIDPDAPPSHSFGYGGARDGQRVPIFHHHAGGAPEVFLANCKRPSFNEDPGFRLYAVRNDGRAGGGQKMLLTGDVSGGRDAWEWANPGIRVLAATSDTRSLSLSIPEDGHGRVGYFRCPPGADYRFVLDVDAGHGGQELDLMFHVHDSKGSPCIAIEGPRWTLEPGRHRRDVVVSVPALADLPSIYSDPNDDRELNLMVVVSFPDLPHDVVIREASLAFADAVEGTATPLIRIDGGEFSSSAFTGPFARLAGPAEMPARSVVTAQAGGSRRITWMLRQTGVKWQVRNALVIHRGEYLEIGPIVNRWMEIPSVLIVPMQRTSVPFVHRLYNVNRARVYPLAEKPGQLRVDVLDTLGPVSVDIVADSAPASVTGGTRSGTSGNISTFTLEGESLRLEFT